MWDVPSSLTRLWAIARGTTHLGDLWSSTAISDIDNDSSNSIRTLDGSSLGGDKSIRVCFRNHCDTPLLCCWMNEKGEPHHFYRLDPCENAGKVVTVSDRIEQSSLGHAFVIAYCPEERIKQVQKSKSLKDTILVGGYRPRRIGVNRDKDENPVHLMEIAPCRPLLRGNCCQPSSSLRRPCKQWKVTVSLGRIDPTPVDTTGKKYIETKLGGWPVRLDPEWESVDENIRKAIEEDLKVLTKCLPAHAREKLASSTPIWINRTLAFGPAASPEKGRGACFHPDVNWLREHGMHPEKAECVEFYDSDDFLDDREHWGPGGVMIHELSHAYHFKVLPDGYDNAEIQECYEAAMRDGLYDCVQVHGSQGPTARAYACENCMEYFAELSTAFLGGKSDEEYNKWYPFNRKQIKEHDPRAYALLKKVWNVEDDDA